MFGLLILFLVAAAALIVLASGVIAWELVHPPRGGVGWAVARGLPIEPSEAGLSSQSWTLDRPDGTRLPVWDIDLQAHFPTYPGLTVILLHGWARSRVDSLSRLRPWLGLAGRAILYDLRGHGESQNGVSRLGDQDRGDLIELIKRVGAGPIILVGHSMGAGIAMAAAADSWVRGLIAGVVAYGPYEEVRVPLTRRLALKGWPTRPFTGLALLMLRTICGIRRVRTIDAATKVCCPVLVIQGRLDAISPGEGSERIAAAAKGRVEWVEGAAHEDTHAVDAKRHDAWIRGFAETACSATARAQADMT